MYRIYFLTSRINSLTLEDLTESTGPNEKSNPFDIHFNLSMNNNYFNAYFGLLLRKIATDLAVAQNNPETCYESKPNPMPQNFKQPHSQLRDCLKS